MLLFSFLVFFPLEFVYSDTCMNNTQHNLILKDVTQGKLSFGVRILDTFLQFEPVSLLACVEQCMRRTGCMSFNFCAKMNYCELNYVEKKNGKHDSSKTKGMYVQSDISSWDKNLLIGNCTNHRCPHNYKCNTSGLCEISDCGKLPMTQNMVVRGQGDHKSGNGVLVGCKEPSVKIDNSSTILHEELLPLKCNDDGVWVFPSLTCDENMLIIENRWHYFSIHALSWWEAELYCRRKNLHLLKNINNLVFDTIRRLQDKSNIKEIVWIGFTRRRIESKERYKYDYEADTFELFDNQQMCVAVYSLRYWHAKNCLENLKFICQQLH